MYQWYKEISGRYRIGGHFITLLIEEKQWDFQPISKQTPHPFFKRCQRRTVMK
jgi:hypothetical protein